MASLHATLRASATTTTIPSATFCPTFPGTPRWSTRNAAKVAAGYAMGADPYQLTEDNDLIADCVKRFAAERQDG